MKVPNVLKTRRKKRSPNTEANDEANEFEDQNSVYIFVYEPNVPSNVDADSKLTKSACGLTPHNSKRLKAPTFTMEGLTNATSSKINTHKVMSTLQVNYPKDLIRDKRKIIPKQSDKVIELAVFVDDELYKLTKTETDKNGGDPIERIQDIVYAYLNAVSLRFLISCQLAELLIFLELQYFMIKILLIL